MKVVNSLPRDKWMSFVNNHPSSNIFHTPYMMDVFKETKDYLPFLFAAINEKDEICGLILSVQIKVLRGIMSRFSSRSINYGGILCDGSEVAKNALSQLIHVYNKSIKNKVLLTEIRNMNSTEDLKVHFEKNGYRYIEYLNYLIDLKRSPDLIFESFSRSCRRNIKRSEKSGVFIEEIVNKEKLPIFYKLIKKTYSRVKIPVADISLFESAFDNLYPNDMVKFFLARLGNEYIAARAILIFKKQIFDWYAGADNNYLKFCPNEMLVWHILKWGSENGFHTFDFGGAGRPNEKYGVRDFKARFSGQLVNYGRYVKVYSPNLYKLANVGYQIYRKM